MAWQRALTGIERWHWLLDRAAPMNVVFVARVRGRIAPERLRRALDVVARHYPTLTARIEPRRRPLFAAADERVPLRVLPWQQGEWRAQAVAQANLRIPTETGPLARVVVLDGEDRSDLLLTYHQAMADGLSGCLLLDEILTVYAGGPLPARVADEVLAPPLEDELGSRLAALITTLREISAARRLCPLPPATAAPPQERRTALLDARLPASFTAALAQRAGEHGSSVHGALAAALLLATGEELRGDRHAQRHTIGCASPVDLRRRIELPRVAMGTLISRVVTCHQVHYDTLFWDLAAEVSGGLRHATASGAAFAYARMRDWAIGGSDARRARIVRGSERFDRAAVIVNNLGRIETYERYGDVLLERLGFLTSANAQVGPALLLSAITAADSTTLNFTFAEPLVGAGRARRVVDGTLKRLQQAAG